MVKINSPPPDPTFPISPKFETLEVGTILRRIYNPNRYKTTAISFRFNGPRSRFDHHRCSYQEPQDDLDRGINYWGFTLSCCLVEVFGDTRVIEVDEYEVALLTLNQSIKLLDLRGAAAMKAGTLSSVSQIAERNLSQLWGKYFYEETEIYGTIDGLIFSNAHNSEDSIALYERAKPQLDSASLKILALNSLALQPAIADCALTNSMIF
ncbi:RES domain-containing protein [Myxosarcina sp. GI1]|uniref:RES domain-containing protein n=1 Tax=Myxosarcina sp. GI1 TaxID=1541065 RepID=UPI000561AA90|nr:RES domain-containing protein [Myxosarcina sp. GI1]